MNTSCTGPAYCAVISRKLCLYDDTHSCFSSMLLACLTHLTCGCHWHSNLTQLWNNDRQWNFKYRAGKVMYFYPQNVSLLWSWTSWGEKPTSNRLGISLHMLSWRKISPQYWKLYVAFFFNDTVRKRRLHWAGYTFVTLPRPVTPYRDNVDGTRDHVTYQKLVTW
jgi:hypothetical protein